MEEFDIRLAQMEQEVYMCFEGHAEAVDKRIAGTPVTIPDLTPALEAVTTLQESVGSARLNVEQKTQAALKLVASLADWLKKQEAVLQQVDSRLE